MPSNVVMTRCGVAIPDAAACAALIPNLAVQIIIIGIVGEFHAFFRCNAMACISASKLVASTMLVNLACEGCRTRRP
jgi:hypothetical protein